MKRSIIITLHVAYWLVYSFLSISTLVVARGNFTGNIYVSFFLNAFLAASCFYIFYFLLVPKFLAPRKIKQFAFSAVGTCAIVAVATLLLQRLFLYSNHAATIQSVTIVPVVLNWFIIITFHLMLGMVHGLLATFMRGFFIWYNEIHLKETLEKKNIETQMALLKARINPHFLFNTLNNIDVLIANNSALASVYLQKLSAILRFAIYENQPERVSLEKELTIMREYIDLESIRTMNKNFISFEVSGSAGEIEIAPMLFIPFLENAFKHSGSKKIEGAIGIKVDIIDDRLIRFLCRNVVGIQQSISSNGGVGLELIKQRLNLLYPDKHTLALQEENGYFEVNLTLNTR